MIACTRSLDDIEPSDLVGFFVGWPDPPDLDTRLQILEAADHRVLARDVDGDEIVGFVTAVTDGILSAYLPLLEVRPEWQGRGVGTRLVEEALDAIGDVYMVDLVCDPELETFYRRLDFEPATAMVQRNYDYQSGTRPDD